MEMILSGVAPDIIERILTLSRTVESNDYTTAALCKEALMNTLALHDSKKEDTDPDTDQLELIMSLISEHESEG